MILLEASGGSIQSQQDRDRVNEYVASGMTEDRAAYRVRLENNEELIKYYKKTFNMKLVDETTRQNGDLMYGTLQDVYEKCGFK